MANDTLNIPRQNSYTSTLTQSLAGDASALTIYVAGVPDCTIPSGVYLEMTINPKKGFTQQEVVLVESIGSNTLTIKSGGRAQNRYRGDSPTALSHAIGSTITLSDPYSLWVGIEAAIEAKLDGATGGTVSGELNFTADSASALFKVPNMTEAIRDTIASPANGMIIYNTTSGLLQVYDGGAWVDIDAGGAIPNASETVAGAVELATVAEQGSATSTGGTGARLVPTNDNLVKSHDVYTPAYLESGSSAQGTFGTWAAVTDGSFRVTVDGTAYNVDAIDFTGDASMADVAATIQAALRAATSSTETVAWQTITKSLVNNTYKWTASGSGTNEYYVELAGGGDPGLGTPATVNENGSGMTEGTVGSLTAGQYDYADNDTLGYSTVYVRLTDEVDPDSKVFGFIDMTFSGFKITSVDTTSSSQVSLLTTSTGTVGTDISGAGASDWMDADTGNGLATAAVVDETQDANKIIIAGSDGRIPSDFLPSPSSGGSAGSAPNTISIPAGEAVDGSTTPQAVYISDGSNSRKAGYFYKADADDLTNNAVRAVGFITSNAATVGTSYEIQISGVVAGFSGLTQGVDYSISATAGSITTTGDNPNTTIGRAISATELMIMSAQPVVHSFLQTATGAVTVGNFIDVTITTGFRPRSATGIFSSVTTDACRSWGAWAGDSASNYWENEFSTNWQQGVDNTNFGRLYHDYSLADYAAISVQTVTNNSITLRITAVGGTMDETINSSIIFFG